MAEFSWETAADLLDHRGGIPAERIRLKPRPGSATEADLLRLVEGPDRWPVELVDGTLVNKALSFWASALTTVVASRVMDHADDLDAGVAFSGMLPFRFGPRTALMPCFTFVSWHRLPDETVPDESIASFIPNLIVEVLSPGNTSGEIRRKVTTYFAGGVEGVWIIDLQSQTASMFDSTHRSVEIDVYGALRGGKVFPDLHVPLRDLFDAIRHPSKRG